MGVAPEQAGAIPQSGGFLVAAMVARRKPAGAFPTERQRPSIGRTGGLATRRQGISNAELRSRVDPAKSREPDRPACAW